MIYIDLDSTLNNFIDNVVDYINTKYNTNYTTKEIEHWEHVLSLFPDGAFMALMYNNPYFTIPVTLKDGAIELLIQLKKYDSVTILTDTLPNMEASKKQWCTHVGLYKHVDDIIFTDDSNTKLSYINKNDVVIDDKFDTVYNAVKDKEAFGLLYRNNDKYGYNDFIYDNYRFKRCNTYEDVLSSIDNIYDVLRA